MWNVNEQHKAFRLLEAIEMNNPRGWRGRKNVFGVATAARFLTVMNWLGIDVGVVFGSRKPWHLYFFRLPVRQLERWSEL